MNFDGAEKAAIIMLALGEEAAGEILQNLDNNEVKRIAVAMSRLGVIDERQMETVVAEFRANFFER